MRICILFIQKRKPFQNCLLQNGAPQILGQMGDGTHFPLINKTSTRHLPARKTNLSNRGG